MDPRFVELLLDDWHPLGGVDIRLICLMLGVGADLCLSNTGASWAAPLEAVLVSVALCMLLGLFPLCE